MGSSPDVKFIHLRKLEIASTGGIKVAGRGGMTIAFMSLPTGGYRVARAKCHDRDNFARKIGRIKAAGRLNSDRQSSEIMADEKTLVANIDAQATALGMVRQYSKRKTRANRLVNQSDATAGGDIVAGDKVSITHT